MTTAATTAAASPTLLFQATEPGTGHRFEVHAILGKSPRYEVRIDGEVERTIPATRAWQREQREAIEWAERELGWKSTTGQPNVGEAAAATGPKPVTPRKVGRMTTLYAEILRERGWAEAPERLLELGREHAETWAALGREAFEHELSRLQAERCEQEDEFDTAARAKVTYY